VKGQPCVLPVNKGEVGNDCLERGGLTTKGGRELRLRNVPSAICTEVCAHKDRRRCRYDLRSATRGIKSIKQQAEKTAANATPKGMRQWPKGIRGLPSATLPVNGVAPVSAATCCVTARVGATAEVDESTFDALPQGSCSFFEAPADASACGLDAPANVSDASGDGQHTHTMRNSKIAVDGCKIARCVHVDGGNCGFVTRGVSTRQQNTTSARMHRAITRVSL
jgi:hypothetical protein